VERTPLNALQVFVTAARAQNMTRAAERLHLTVSALSHQVRLLEERLNCRLFVRGPRGLKLTVEGDLLLQRVGPQLDAIESALRPLCMRSGRVLSLSALPSMASSWLVPRLPRFVARHPDLDVATDVVPGETVDTLLGDLDADRLAAPADPDRDSLDSLIAERQPDAVSYAGWQAVDRVEREAGEPHGRPRVKLCSFEELLEAAKDATPAP